MRAGHSGPNSADIMIFPASAHFDININFAKCHQVAQHSVHCKTLVTMVPVSCVSCHHTNLSNVSLNLLCFSVPHWIVKARQTYPESIKTII